MLDPRRKELAQRYHTSLQALITSIQEVWGNYVDPHSQATMDNPLKSKLRLEECGVKEGVLDREQNKARYEANASFILDYLFFVTLKTLVYTSYDQMGALQTIQFFRATLMPVMYALSYLDEKKLVPYVYHDKNLYIKTRLFEQILITIHEYGEFVFTLYQTNCNHSSALFSKIIADQITHGISLEESKAYPEFKSLFSRRDQWLNKGWLALFNYVLPLKVNRIEGIQQSLKVSMEEIRRIDHTRYDDWVLAGDIAIEKFKRHCKTSFDDLFQLAEYVMPKRERRVVSSSYTTNVAPMSLTSTSSIMNAMQNKPLTNEDYVIEEEFDMIFDDDIPKTQSMSEEEYFIAFEEQLALAVPQEKMENKNDSKDERKEELSALSPRQ